jgi:hypothetical protein
MPLECGGHIQYEWFKRVVCIKFKEQDCGPYNARLDLQWRMSDIEVKPLRT